MGVNIKSFRDKASRMDELMQLDSAPYIKNAKKSVDLSKVVGIEMSEGGVTNPDSSYPLLAATSVATCMAIFIHNPKTLATGLVHIVEDGASSFPRDSSVESLFGVVEEVQKPDCNLSFLRRMWSRSDKMEARIVGPNLAGDSSDPFINNVLDFLAQHDIYILSSDWKNKAGPSAVAVDSARWNYGLIRGNVDSINFFDNNDSEDIAIEKARLYQKQRGDVVDLSPAFYFSPVSDLDVLKNRFSDGVLAFNGLHDQRKEKHEPPKPTDTGNDHGL